jgi:hypothetical protein
MALRTDSHRISGPEMAGILELDDWKVGLWMTFVNKTMKFALLTIVHPFVYAINRVLFIAEHLWVDVPFSAIF